MGQILEIQTNAVIKPKMGDARQLVLPGGGDVASRVWASMRVKTESLRRWMSKGSFITAAAKDAINQLENFMIGEGQLYEHVWKNPECVQRCFRTILEKSRNGPRLLGS